MVNDIGESLSLEVSMGFERLLYFICVFFVEGIFKFLYRVEIFKLGDMRIRIGRIR